MDIERRIREVFNWQEKKEREYLEIAADIIDAIDAKIKASGTNRFKLPFEARGIFDGVARCHLSGGQRFYRTATIIEGREDLYMDERAERSVTIIKDQEYSKYDKYPFCQYIEQIYNEGNVSKYIKSRSSRGSGSKAEDVEILKKHTRMETGYFVID